MSGRARTSRGLIAAVVAAASLGGATNGPAASRPPAAAKCPTAPARGSLPSAATLRSQNTFLGALGARPTGSPAQERYIAWILARLHRIPGVRISELRFPIERWTASAASFELRAGNQVQRLPVADAIPYAQPTSARGVSAPLVVIPDQMGITAANARGKMVVREADPGSVSQAAFMLPIVGWSTYDPKHTIDPSGTFYGDFIAYNQRIADLEAAAAAGAKGLLFVKNLPRTQIVGHYEPYEGLRWNVPGVFLGADQGQLITDAIAARRHPSGRIEIRGGVKRVVTPSILATIRGAHQQRIVIDSHTDGTNAVEDNGPIAMVAIARYLAGLPLACRPRTIEFAFSTAHFYQRVVSPRIRDGGAEQLAEQLDRDYDRGTVSAGLTLEHMGAIDYEGVPRTRGPGLVLKPNGLRAIQFIGVTPSPQLISTVSRIVSGYDMQRTILLRGSDAPGTTVPAHCSFGGEGTPYEKHLLPTVGEIAAPQSLYDPAFGISGIDFSVMHSELQGFTELVNRLGTMPQAAIAGQVSVERRQRAAGARACPA
jgi:hypothetical protein